ncbi:hypothetical protein [Roseixanthobacter glucoisosaccharinicivorans]|uniref:hypothetical protein n=1 Tax=Roseixanthobacter glucoisosaccharinicivorans TaxID=3119923 RepID=UPI0037261F9E
MANVIDERNRAATALRRDLPDAFVTVLGPDHPFLLKGPDIIIGGEGKLTAIYVPAVAERKGAQDQLRTRYVLSRLALPQHTRHILTWGRNWDEGVASDLAESFADTLSLDSRAGLRKIAEDGNFVGRQRPIAKENLQEIRNRFSQALFVTRLANRTASRELDSPILSSEDPKTRHRPRLIDTHMTTDKVMTHYYDDGVATKDFVQSLLVSTVPDRHPLVQGQPKLVGHPFDIALLKMLRPARGDPLKVRRAAAFAGWVLLDEHQGELSGAIADRLSRG